MRAAHYRYMAPGLSYEREGAGEVRQREHLGWMKTMGLFVRFGVQTYPRTRSLSEAQKKMCREPHKTYAPPCRSTHRQQKLKASLGGQYIAIALNSG